MANTNEGLEVESAASPERDVNTDAGFLAALAGATKQEVPEDLLQQADEQDRTVESALEYEESSEGRQRDDRGRFVAAEVTPPPASEETPPVEGKDATTPEAAPVVDWEQRYKKLEGAFGRQGQEKGEEVATLRSELDQLKGRLDERDSFMPAAPRWNSEQVEEMVDTQGGAQTALQALYENPGSYDAVLKAWAEVDEMNAIEAQRFDARYQRELVKAESEEAAGKVETPPVDPTLRDIVLERQIGATLNEVESTMAPNEWAVIRDHLVSTLTHEDTPALVREAVISEDAATRQQGIKALVGLAKGHAIAAATIKATDATKETQIAAKKAAAVATGSLRPVTEGNTGESLEGLTPEERTQAITKRLHDALMATETTSVADGLTYG